MPTHASPTPQRPKNQWTAAQKQFVLLLSRYSENTFAEITKVFNIHFAHDLRFHGFGPNGIPQSSVHSRWYCLMVDGLSNLDYREIHAPEFNVFHREDPELKRAIESVAEAAGVGIVWRLNENTEVLQHFEIVRRRRMLNPRSRQVARDSRLQGRVEANLEPSVADRSQRTNTSSRSSYTLREFMLRLPDGEMLAPVAFRTWSASSQGANTAALFRAGRFRTLSSCIIPVSSYREELESAADHINRKKCTPSPWISVSNSLIWSLSKAYKANEDPSEVFITMVNLYQVAESTRVWPADYVCKEIRRMSWCDYPHYNGTAEWLVYGEIRKDAIIGTTSLRHIEQMSSASPSLSTILQLPLISSNRSMRWIRAQLETLQLDQDIGKSVGELMKAFDRSFDPQFRLQQSRFSTARLQSPRLTHFIRTVLQNWKISSDLVNWDTHEAFMKGLRMSLAGQSDDVQAPPTPPVTPGGDYQHAPPPASRPRGRSLVTEMTLHPEDLSTVDTEMMDAIDDSDPDEWEAIRAPHSERLSTCSTSDTNDQRADLIKPVETDLVPEWYLPLTPKS